MFVKIRYFIFSAIIGYILLKNKADAACNPSSCPTGWTQLMNYCLQRHNCTTNSYVEAVSLCSTLEPSGTLLDPFLIAQEHGEHGLNILTYYLRGQMLKWYEFYFVNGHYASGDGENGTFTGYYTGEVFGCLDARFCDGSCVQNATDRPILFWEITQTVTCLANSPDFQYDDPIICQIRVPTPVKCRTARKAPPQ